MLAYCKSEANRAMTLYKNVLIVWVREEKSCQSVSQLENKFLFYAVIRVKTINSFYKLFSYLIRILDDCIFLMNQGVTSAAKKPLSVNNTTPWWSLSNHSVFTLFLLMIKFFVTKEFLIICLLGAKKVIQRWFLLDWVLFWMEIMDKLNVFISLFTNALKLFHFISEF